jgi:hypothetical protein
MHPGLKKQALCGSVAAHGSPATLLKHQMAHRLKLFMSFGSRKKEPRYTCLSEAKASTPTEDVGRGFILHSTLHAQWAVRQPHQVKVPTQGIVSSKESGNHPGLYPVEG